MDICGDFIKLFFFPPSTLPETNSLPLKMDGWNTGFLLGWPIFRCEVLLVSGSVMLLVFAELETV